MRAKKLFYIIEPIDVDGDKIPDGFLASQYRIDKYGNKILTKNKYITFTALKSKIAKKGGIKVPPTANPNNNNNNDVVVMSKADFNKFMNQQNAYNPYNHPHNPYNPYNPYNHPPGVLVNNGDNNYNNGNQNTFMGNMANSVGQGVGLGFGVAAGDALFDGVASFF